MYYGYGYYPFFDPTMILVLIGVILSLAASAKVKSTFARYSKVRSMTGMTGAEAAQRLLNSQGIYDVTVRRVPGSLSDHYDPRTKTVNLSDDVYSSTSVAAIGVAAHECGHAIQHAVGYAPLNFRSALVPIANFGSGLQKVLSFIPSTYGTSLLKNHMLRGVFEEMRASGFPEEVVKGIADSLDCNPVFQGKEVTTEAMLLIMVLSIVVFMVVYLILTNRQEKE